MKSIVNTEAVVQAMGRWYAGDLSSIQSLRYSLTGAGKADMEIEFLASRRDLANGGWPSDEAPQYIVCVGFMGVQDLTLRQLGSNSQVMGFDIQDVSGRGWEGCNFLIEDYENGRLSFRCAEIMIRAVEPIGRGRGGSDPSG
jgi:hypothetical protein